MRAFTLTPGGKAGPAIPAANAIRPRLTAHGGAQRPALGSAAASAAAGHRRRVQGEDDRAGEHGEPGPLKTVPAGRGGQQRQHREQQDGAEANLAAARTGQVQARLRTSAEAEQPLAMGPVASSSRAARRPGACRVNSPTIVARSPNSASAARGASCSPAPAARLCCQVSASLRAASSARLAGSRGQAGRVAGDQRAGHSAGVRIAVTAEAKSRHAARSAASRRRPAGLSSQLRRRCRRPWPQAPRPARPPPAAARLGERGWQVDRRRCWPAAPP